MDERINGAARHVGAQPGQVMSGRVYADHVAIVIDWGIKGGKKYLVPLVDLCPPEPTTKREPLNRDALACTAAAARLAQQHNINISTITGTGKGGRITVSDVRETIHGRSDSAV